MEPQTTDKAPAKRTASPAVTFRSLTFSDGTVISLDQGDVVVFVGPNNAGKSVALRELEKYVGSTRPKMVIKDASLEKTGTIDELRDFLERHGRQAADRLVGFRYNIRGGDLATRWKKDDLASFRPLFCTRIKTETRITDSDPQDAIALLDQPPHHPIHILYSDDRIADRISKYFRRGFGEDLIVFYAGGSKTPLLTGQRPVPKAGEDRVSASYNERLLASTVPLQKQGDGMRSFASVILHMLAPSTPSILLLDEPEAFLHPPQARLLGEFIANERPENTQLFLATHSADVLQGLLNVVSEHLRVLRIQREGAVNRVKELDKTRAKAIGADPLMKFSSVLAGIFHQRVIVCEADADCMFYSAVLDLPEVRGELHPDVLFVQAGGKSRMSSLVEALRALDVTVDVIADMDILNEEAVLARVVRALGGEWPRVQAHARPLKAAIEQNRPWLKAREVAKDVQEIVARAPASGKFPKELRAEINAVFRKASPWDVIKDAGQAAIPSGQATSHYLELQNLCNAVGIWIVPVGELEGFCKSVGRLHGPGWVQQVIDQQDLAKDEEIKAAREFVRRVWISRPSVSSTTTDARLRGIAGNGDCPEADEPAPRMSAPSVDPQV